MDGIWDLIGSVSEGFPTYFCLPHLDTINSFGSDDLLVKLAFVSNFLRSGGWRLPLIKLVVLMTALIFESFIKFGMLFFI